MDNKHYEKCNLCHRTCGVNRSTTKGYCGVGSSMLVSRAALHYWEEPIISGTNGSGTVFFSGCSLGCVFCQNRRISRGGVGKELTPDNLCEIMLRLQNEGAHNINFVTPTHFAPSIAKSIDIARGKGLTIPTVYNTGSFDTVQTLKMLDGRIDIYLPDFKFYRAETAKKLANAPSYPDLAREAIAEMVRQRPTPIIEDGIMKSGVIVRILLLPSHLAEAKLAVKYLYSTYGDNIYVSLMNQYTPMPNMAKPLNRKVTSEEYDELVDYAARLGITNCFIQEGGTAEESFIPDFDNTGV